MHLIERIASALTAWSVRWVPNSFIIAFMLTLIVFATALTLTSAGPLDCVTYWGDGIVIFTAYALLVTVASLLFP
ncbi:MAG: hypothetical protein GF341_09650 [candidate division Zixibacteria bacterium]|nr:hypothetical protein [candidate division Zixibacteria bacterium]